MPVLKGRCQERAEPVQRWFYNPASSSCERFLFSGCHGNGNNFLTQQACEEQCMLGACCFRFTGSERRRHGALNSSFPESSAGDAEWAGPGLNVSLEAWQSCGSRPISCEHVSVSQCQHKGTAVSFSPGRPCPAQGCVSARRGECVCVFNGRSFKPGEAFEVGCEACVCTYRGVVECTCRSPQPRKEIRDLSQSELREYQRAVRALYLQPGTGCHRD
ncbi:papilin-like [Clupea harengus]|uniref:Papilin-like n=1 Tax=Clupea harengus TaxID=7950 RepID=A0A8M1K7B0_CLUHA|nr:papilin-like [Clupea harengus]